MPANTLVRDVMTRDVATLRAEQSIADAADNMASHNYGAMPVVDDAGRVIGLLRDSDFVVSEARVHVPTFLNILGASIPLPGEMSHVEEELHKVAGSTVGEVMEADPPTAAPEDTLEDIATQMHDHEISHLPVVEGDRRLIGIVARGDIVRFIARTT
jgi:CBS domain-containing protein